MMGVIAMNISQIAENFALTPATLRYYEKLV